MSTCRGREIHLLTEYDIIMDPPPMIHDDETQHASKATQEPVVELSKEPKVQTTQNPIRLCIHWIKLTFTWPTPPGLGLVLYLLRRSGGSGWTSFSQVYSLLFVIILVISCGGGCYILSTSIFTAVIIIIIIIV